MGVLFEGCDDALGGCALPVKVQEVRALLRDGVYPVLPLQDRGG